MIDFKLSVCSTMIAFIINQDRNDDYAVKTK